jgi:hypothetical protein
VLDIMRTSQFLRFASNTKSVPTTIKSIIPKGFYEKTAIVGAGVGMVVGGAYQGYHNNWKTYRGPDIAFGMYIGFFCGLLWPIGIPVFATYHGVEYLTRPRKD